MKPLGERFRAVWPEVLVFCVALAFRASLLLRLHGSVLDGNLVADERTYWGWSEHILRSGPVGPNPFFMGPLYPYVLAATRLLFGISTTFPLLVLQAVLGSVACAVLTSAARRLTSAPIAAAAGLMAAAYQMAIFHDALVLMESLLFFLAACLVWAAVDAAERGCGRTQAIALGALVGLLSQGRGLFVLLLFALWPLLRTGPRAGLRSRAVLAAAAFAIVCVPAAWHNARVSGSFIPFTYNLGMNFYIGNHDGASGTWAVVTEHERPGAETSDTQGGNNFDGRAQLEAELGYPVGAAESSREWMKRALQFWREQPGEALRITGRKFAMVVSRDEFPQLESPEVFVRLIGFLGLVPFWLIALVALPSLLHRPGDAATRFLVLSFLLLAAGTAAFFVVDRYRLHLVPFLVPLAATTLARLSKARGFAALGGDLLRVAASAALVCIPVPHPTPEQSEWAVEGDIGDRWAYAGRYDVALQWYGRAEARVRSGAVAAGTSLTGRRLVGVFEQDVAAVALAAGDTSHAIAALTQASELAGESQALRNQAALLLAVQGRSHEARLFLPGGRDAATAFEALAKAAGALAAGNTTRADDWIEAAVVLDSSGLAPREARIRLAIDTHRLDRAAALLRADAPLLGAASANAHESMLALRAGDSAKARRLLASIPEGADLTPPTRAMVDWLRSQLAAPVRPTALRSTAQSR